jgi:hypothetical protein
MAKKKMWIGSRPWMWLGGGAAVAGAGYLWWGARARWLVLEVANKPPVWVKFDNVWDAQKAQRQAAAWGAATRIELQSDYHKPPNGAIESHEWEPTDVEVWVSAGLGNAPAQVQDWGKRGMHLGPYHESSTHGDSPFLFGNHDGHYHQITMPDGTPWRTHKDYLTGLGKVERMHAEAWKEGRKSWVDITPQGGPKMRVTHQIFGGERGAGY